MRLLSSNSMIIDEEILTYTWTVNTDTGEISSVNQEAKRISSEWRLN